MLRDVQNLGIWQYPDEDLASAVRTTFALGKAPAAYSLTTGAGTVAQLASATEISPALSGASLSRVLYETALLIAQGMVGASDIRTRSITLKEGPERKLALLMAFNKELARLDEEGADESPIATGQGLVQWLIATNGGEDAWGLASTATYSGGSAYSF